MPDSLEEAALPPPVSPAAETLPSREIEAHETWNLWTLALHQITLRVGWTFKTESILVPAFLDTVVDAGWLRGSLPLANRMGQSIPPVLAAESLKRLRQKKWALAGFAAAVGLPYLILALVWFANGGRKNLVVAAAFLALQFLFYVFYGLYQTAFSTVQGKLIRPTRRGQLLWGSTFWGLFPTIFFCQWLMPDWIGHPVPGFGYLFLFVGMSLAASGAIVGALAEPADATDGSQVPRRASLAETFAALRRDRNLRRLVVLVVWLFLGLVTIPHYQSYARKALGAEAKDLVFMVITHTTAVSIYSLFLGPVADRWGNRLTLRLLILGAAIAPAYALVLPSWMGGLSRQWFWVVFIPLGLTPLVPTIVFNYALELCRPPEHPRYVSMVNLAMMPPFLLSPLVGMAVDAFGFPNVAIGTCIVMVGCGALTFWLEEPRRLARNQERA